MSEDNKAHIDIDPKLAEALSAAEEAVAKKPGEATAEPTAEPAAPEPAAAAPANPGPAAGGGDPAAEWRARAFREAADKENLKKRFNKERDELRRFAVEGLLKDMLPVADNLERALDASTEETPFVEGVRLVHSQLMQTLERYGARPFDAKGSEFDPQIHEAMSQVPRDDVEPNTVVEVFQRGWMLHDRLVRPAMVIVSTSP